jgi:hypothetical protein
VLLDLRGLAPGQPNPGSTRRAAPEIARHRCSSRLEDPIGQVHLQVSLAISADDWPSISVYHNAVGDALDNAQAESTIGFTKRN